MDIPVPGGGGRSVGLQGFPSEQSSTPTRSSRKRISERIVQQIVDIPGGGLQDFRPGQSSSSSSHVPARVHEALDEPGEGGFRTFTKIKNVRSWVRTRVGTECGLYFIHVASSCRAHGSRGGRASVGGIRGRGGPRPMEGRVWPHVVEVGTLPWEVVLLATGLDVDIIWE